MTNPVPAPPAHITFYWCEECGKFLSYQPLKHLSRLTGNQCGVKQLTPIEYERKRFGPVIPENVMVAAGICDADASSQPSEFVEERQTPKGRLFVFRSPEGTLFGVRNFHPVIHTGDDIEKI